MARMPRQPDLVLAGSAEKSRLSVLTAAIGGVVEEDTLVCWINSSKFRPESCREFRSRIIFRILEEIAIPYSGKAIFLETDDIVAIFRVPEAYEHVALIDHLDEILCADHDEFSSGGDYYTLPYDKELLDARIESERAAAARRNFGTSPNTLSGDPGLLGFEGEIDIQLMQKFEIALRGSDVTNFMRRQAVVKLKRDGVDRVVFHEFFVSLPALSKEILPGKSLTSNEHHLQHVSRILDHNLTSSLRSSPVGPGVKAISLNVSLINFSGDKRFASKLLDLTDRFERVLIELSFSDVISNLDEFLILRSYLTGKNIEIVIDRIRPSQVQFIQPDLFRASYYKVLWTEGENKRRGANEAFQSFIEAVGKKRVILTQCDSLGAVKYGTAHKVNKFQGWFIDRLLKEKGGDLELVPSRMPTEMKLPNPVKRTA